MQTCTTPTRCARSEQMARVVGRQSRDTSLIKKTTTTITDLFFEMSKKWELSFSPPTSQSSLPAPYLFVDSDRDVVEVDVNI